jgi:hypothetical protein
MLTHPEALRVARLWAISAPYSEQRALANRVLLAHIRALPEGERSGVIWALSSAAAETIREKGTK